MLPNFLGSGLFDYERVSKYTDRITLASDMGGGLSGIYSAVIENNVIFENWAGHYSGGMGGYDCSGVVLRNCIFWGNTAVDGRPHLPYRIYPEYCCIEGYTDGGLGNIRSNPQFVDPGGGDFHLKSEAGRWDSASETWVQDGVTSPCIDRGDTNSDWTGELWPHGKRINMGAYGGTAEASMSQSSEGNAADCNYDDAVNGTDLEMIAERWLDEGVLLVEDVNRDGVINFPDFALLAQSWLWEQ